MKKILFILSAFALGLSFTACDEKGGDDFDFGSALEDGCYVSGPATGYDNLVKETMMVIGINEAADKTPRTGMYEKYIVLEADKDFYLVWKNGKQEVKYGAELEVYDASIYDENPEENMYRGELVTVNAPAMKVTKTGMYHIILDLNIEKVFAIVEAFTGFELDAATNILAHFCVGQNNPYTPHSGFLNLPLQMFELGIVACFT